MSAGIFGLSAYNDKNLEGLIPDKTREAFREFGYWGKGRSPGSTLLSRVDYSNDTQLTSLRGNFLSSVRLIGAAGNSNFGYFAGGLFISKIERVDYSNDSTNAIDRSALSFPRGGLSGSGNQNFGYFYGGAPTPAQRIVDRLDYSNDTSFAVTRSPLVAGRRYHASTGNPNFGYIAGSPSISTIERNNYSNDTASPLNRGGLANTRRGLAATGNPNFGYFVGGSPARANVDRIDYSNDLTNASPRGPLAASHRYLSATGNSNFGYVTGGVTPGSSTTMSRIDYSNDSVTASARGPLETNQRFGMGATSSHNFGGTPISQYGVFPKPFGYFGGGTGTSAGSTVDRIDYANDTSNSSKRGPLSTSKAYHEGTGNSNFGYFAGSNTKVDRIDYSNDSATSSVRGPLTLARPFLTAIGNSNFGYFGGGYNPSGAINYSTIERIDYLNDSVTATVRNQLDPAGSRESVGNSNFSYFCGGRTAATIFSTHVNRLNYSSDTTALTTRGNLLTGIIWSQTTSNSSYGWLSGSFQFPSGLSTIWRVDFSNDLPSPVVRSTLNTGRGVGEATGNSNFGYIAGGLTSNFVGPSLSSIERLDYANDTQTPTFRGPLSGPKKAFGASSATDFGGAFDFQPTSTFFDIQSMRRIEDTTNASVKKRVLGSYGYFGGGQKTYIERINFSNDLVTETPRANLPDDYKLGPTAFGNSNFGYWGGGYAPGNRSVVNRLDYSNDTANTSRVGNLTSSKRNLHSSQLGNDNYGYVCGGTYFPESRIDRIDYSNDSIDAIIRTRLPLPTYDASADGNYNFGYISGGSNSPTGGGPATNTSMRSRLNYANDLAVSLVRGPLLDITTRSCGVSNSNFGYVGGGIIPGPAVISTVQKIDYSNDTSAPLVRGPIPVERYGMAGSGNSNFGYFATSAFHNSPTADIMSSVYRIDYSNDNVSSSLRGILNNPRDQSAGTSNARNS